VADHDPLFLQRWDHKVSSVKEEPLDPAANMIGIHDGQERKCKVSYFPIALPSDRKGKQ